MSKKNSLIRYSLYSSANANLIFVQNFSTFNTYSDTSYGTVYEKATDFCRIKKNKHTKLTSMMVCIHEMKSRSYVFFGGGHQIMGAPYPTIMR